MTKLTTRSEQRTKATSQVLTETFDAVHDLGVDADAGRRESPLLEDVCALARAARDRCDVVEYDRQLRELAAVAIIDRAQLRTENPDLGGDC